jgi:hypothetical protein
MMWVSAEVGVVTASSGPALARGILAGVKKDKDTVKHQALTIVDEYRLPKVAARIVKAYAETLERFTVKR